MNLKPILGGVFATAIAASAWTIDGTVTNVGGTPLAGVDISSFNYAGIAAKTDNEGKFFINSGTGSIAGSFANTGLSVKKEGFTLNFTNPRGGTFKVYLMDALGKMLLKQEFSSQNATVDYRKFSAQKFMILKVSFEKSSENYVLSHGALMKTEELLASLLFVYEGYQNYNYKMKAEIETGVKIVMEAATTASSSSVAAAVSSSSVAAAAESSSSQNATPAPAETSSSKAEEVVVNCAGKTLSAGDQNLSVNVGGKNRTFIMHVPSAYKGDKAVPLVVDYHPIGGSGAGQLSGTTYKAQTDGEGVISLYPDGTGGKSMMGAGWNVGPCCSNDDDVEFSREMIKAVQEKACIDPKRIYATGFSMGGGMSNHVACNMADVYAAVAPAAMDLNTTNSASCNPPRPISIIMFRGTNDNVCRYQGGDSGFNDGLNFLGAEGNFKFWAEKNGCTGSPSKNSDGCDEYSSCKDGVKVVLCTKNGGGHEQGNGAVGWPFLKSFTMP